MARNIKIGDEVAFLYQQREHIGVIVKRNQHVTTVACSELVPSFGSFKDHNLIKENILIVPTHRPYCETHLSLRLVRRMTIEEMLSHAVKEVRALGKIRAYRQRK